MPQLLRVAPKLLSFVNGKPHATANDHEEKYRASETLHTQLLAEESSDERYRQEQTKTNIVMKSHWESESGEDDENIYGSPVSSGDEAPPPVKKTSPPPPPPAAISKPSKSARTNTLDVSRPPAKRKSVRPKPPRVPAGGAFIKSQEEKRKSYGVQEGAEVKENAGRGSSSQPVVGKRSVEPEDDRPLFADRFENSGPKKPRTAPYTPNLFVAPRGSAGIGNKSMYGTATSRGSGVSSKASTKKKPKTFSRKARVPTPDPPADRDDDIVDSDGLAKVDEPRTKKQSPVPNSDDEEVECLPLDIDLLKPKKKAKGSAKVVPTKPVKPTKTSLLEQLADFRRDQTPSTSQPTGSGNTSIPNLDPDAASASSPLSSPGSAHHAEAIKDVENYMGDLEEEEPEDPNKCPLCEEAVERSYYFDFWIGKKKTVFYQTMFCKEHKRRKALDEYKKRGYIEIDWDDFPSKIRDYHPRLKAVLRNEKPSEYRDKHAQRLADRDARAVRKQLDSDTAYDSTTGYYGSRGKRAMMEGITSQLGPVIKECVERDPVVAFNGFATFIQSVLVPELTVWMIMDDKGCSEMKAREIVQESGALGEVVNEEVEDRVAVVESEDESELEELEGLPPDE